MGDSQSGHITHAPGITDPPDLGVHLTPPQSSISWILHGDVFYCAHARCYLEVHVLGKIIVNQGSLTWERGLVSCFIDTHLF